MQSLFEKKWYKFLFNKCSILNPGIVYKSIGGTRILLSDIFIQPNIVQDAVYGIGRNISEDSNAEPNVKYNKYTVDDLLSTKKNNRHLIIGSLGSGKTSLVNHIITQIAEYKLYGRETSSSVVSVFKDKYVCYMPLKEITRDTEEKIFDNFELNEWIINKLKKVLNSSEQKEVDEHFAEVSKNGTLLLVDGLDEIDIEERKKILQILNLFCDNPDNVVIATIRKEVLVEDSWLSEISGYQQIILADFNPKQIRDYICKWKDYASKIDEDSSLDVDVIAKTIFDNCYLKELASNPLFLTLMMLIAENEGVFPKSRTKVYEEATRLIIERWNEKSFESAEEALKIREALEQAAFDGMNNLIGQNKRYGDTSAYISDAFTKMFPDKKVAKYIKAVSEKTGIIVQTGDSKYTFALQSFMEYFAASYISKKLDIVSFIEEQKEKLVPWQEVVVFGVTKIALERVGIATAILYQLVKSDYQFKNKIAPEKILISGMITQELLCESNNHEIIVFKERIKSWLKHYICDKSITYRLRFEIGNVLGRLGDDRIGVGIRKIYGVDYPDIKWIRIPSGISEFGSPQGHINKVHFKELSEYLISMYPITNEQFRPFLAQGYSKKEYWTNEGWAWVNGQDEIYFKKETSGRYTEERKKQYEIWLKSRVLERRKEPFWWQDYPWNIANRPVVGITWYEAVAYCNWLNIECRMQLKVFLSDEEFADAQICLPTLEEWEKAARGPKCTKYPWGKNLDYKRIRANVDICNLNQTCAVGIFSEGKSGYGLYDVAGNVYEWISTGVTQIETEKWKRECENLEEKYERLVKGGAWNMDYEQTKAAYDEWDYPLIFDQNTGFRPIIRLKRGNDDNRTS